MEIPSAVQDPPIVAPSTTERLFPDFANGQTPTIPDVLPPPATDQPIAEPTPIVEGENAKAAVAKTKPRDDNGKFVKGEKPPVTLNDLLAQYPDVKAKVKVGGQELEVTAQDLLRGYQTDQYLTKKGQKLAEDKKRLETAMNAAPQPTATPSQTPAPSASSAPQGQDWLAQVIAPYTQPLVDKIASLESELQQVRPATHQIMKERYLSAIDQSVREETGQSDFRSYVPKIEMYLQGLSDEDPDRVRLDTPEGYGELYYRMKTKDMLGHTVMESQAPTPTQTRVAPKLLGVESASGTPASAEARAAMMARDFDAAKKAGNLQAMASYIQKYGLL